MMGKQKKHPFIFEHYHEPVISQRDFIFRFFRSMLIAFIVILFSLTIGIWGYHYFGNLRWIDALLNASMILTGMGPVNEMTNNDGKIFSSIYALYSGIAFLTIVAVLLAPIVHRYMHKFHLDMEEKIGEK